MASSEIRVYDVDGMRTVRRAHITGDAGRLVFSANGAVLAVADDSNHLLLWRWQVPNAAPSIEATEPGAIGALAIGDSDRVVAYTVGGRVVVVRDMASHRELARLSEEDEVLALGFSPDGRQLGLASADGVARVVLWRPADLIREAEQRLSPAR
jgi:tricorn protease-like protein